MKDWEELVNKLVDGSMHGYCSAFQERKWFFEIDLAPAFTSAAWEILKFQARGQNPRHVKFPELQEVVVNVYEEKLDRIRARKGCPGRKRAGSAVAGPPDADPESKESTVVDPMVSLVSQTPTANHLPPPALLDAPAWPRVWANCGTAS